MLRLVNRLSRRQFGLVTVGLLATPGLAGAQGPVRLTVVGADGSQTQLADTDLDRLPAHVMSTRTVWTEGVQTFEGVLLRDIFTLVGIDANAGGRNFEARAQNDYTVDIPLSDAVKWDVMIARRMGGKVLTLRDKGPLWLVYPRDAHEELRDARFDHKWVWQLRQLKVL